MLIPGRGRIMGAQAAGTIFISYRRDDDPGYTLALYQQLDNAFSASQIFMDVEGDIHAGEDFTRVLTERVGQCSVMLAVIGPRWAALLRERAAAPNDFLQIEIEAALKQGKPIIPVLVNGAAMPGPDELPEKLQDLWRFNAFRLRHESFRADCDGLVAEVSALLKGKKRSKPPSRIDRAEELANWAIIKDSGAAVDIRGHLARFSSGETGRLAHGTLEQIVWPPIIAKPSVKAMKSYLIEFPDGAHACDAERYIRQRWIYVVIAAVIALAIYLLGMMSSVDHSGYGYRNDIWLVSTVSMIASVTIWGLSVFVIYEIRPY